MAFQHGQLSITSDPRSPNPRHDRIYVHYKKRMIRIMTSEIRYAEAHRAYCLLVMTDGRQFTLSLSLGSLERQLPACNLVRIHRSYLVNALHVNEILEHSVLSGNKQLPVSRGCREALLGSLRIIGKG
ncbi:MAG: LytR/AlgR family response regulator transcription factor [Lewinella sp.]